MEKLSTAEKRVLCFIAFLLIGFFGGIILTIYVGK
jgi:hypothetical protein